MGILRKGVFGGFENKTGPLVGRSVNGKSVISVVKHKAAKPVTFNQLDHRLRFEMVVAVLKWFNDWIAIGFKGPGVGRNTFGAAVKYNFSSLVAGIAPTYYIDYSKLVYSRGSLAGPHHAAIERHNDEVQLSWLPDVETQYNQYSDEASFVIYCPDKEMILKFRNRTTRVALGAVLSLPTGLEQADLYAWMSFSSADGKVVSDSVYLGTI